MSHSNISLFVPHLGCPHRCSFCDQNTITGSNILPRADDVEKAVMTARMSGHCDSDNTEIAFFGGSFTGIERGYMEELLGAAKKFKESKDVYGIRISTRPDYIDGEILSLLKKYGVTAIELGAQSMCDDVLAANNRGHSAEDVIKASKLIKRYDISLGLQMMTGLYKSTYEKDIYTAESIIALNPDAVRIYPTVTLEGTYLARLLKTGEYVPPTLDETVELCTELLEKFGENGINVIRCGLHSIDTSRYLGGPWHPSFKELCDSRRYLELIRRSMHERGEYRISVNPKCVSKALGNKRGNLEKLKADGYICTVKADENVQPWKVLIERMSNS